MAIQEENSGKRPRHNFVATIIVMCKRVKLKNIFDQTVYLAWHFHSFPFLGFSFCWTTVERQFNKQRKQIFCFRVRHQLIFCHFIEMDNFSNFDVSYKRVFLKKPFGLIQQGVKTTDEHTQHIFSDRHMNIFQEP
jgi:hypothetical protein